MANMPPWSYSSLSAFETCPRQYHLVKVVKKVKEPPAAYQQWGIEVHKAFEDGLVENKPLPDKMAEWQPILTKFQLAPGKKEAELKMALDRNFKPVDWWDKSAWARGIGDVVLENGDKAFSGDYKTGKRKPGSSQLKLFAALLMQAREYLQEVKTSFIWLPIKKLDTERFTRDDLGDIWKDFIPRTVQMEKAFAADKWMPKPSGLCNGWCPVGRDNCEYWKPKRS